MPIPANFRFHACEPAARREAERRAILLFGADWRAKCMPGHDRDRRFCFGVGEDSITARGSFVISWKNGEENDLPDGTPSVMQFYPNGQVWSTRRHQNGVLTDMSDGTPAIIQFYASGNVQSIQHLRNNELTDLPDGTPAEIDYAEDGSIAGGHSAVGIKKLTGSEVEERLAAAKQFRIRHAISQADTAVSVVGMHVVPLTELPSELSAQDGYPTRM